MLSSSWAYSQTLLCVWAVDVKSFGGYAVSGHGQMMDVETTTSYSEFINCDRTGRRNAVSDIQGQGAATSTSELAKDMEGMDLKGAGESGASPTPGAEGSTSQEAQGNVLKTIHS
ncbi:hypothetical protein DPEC_G00012940 [Dallia pectoralis]|uniref:Uncharacterized protein n=1 Tax=Dallia pectoralis TaxID=75939 RepID=A0ACC2HME2_DALPE|nr:hypothetical protein DPEC_G00012940 [Dallia pectoralis]